MAVIEEDEHPMSGDRASGATGQILGHQSQIRVGDFEGSGVGSNGASAVDE